MKETVTQYAGAFELPLKVWKGLDETAAVIGKPWLLYPVMDLISRRIAPHKIRFVVVKGSVEDRK